MWHMQKIPRIIHLYWGNDTLSFLRYLTVLSLKKYNPDWQIKLYFPKIKYRGDWTWSTDHQKAEFQGENYIDKLMHMPIDKIEIDFAELGIDNNIPETYKGDFLRWHVLSTQGGLWSDFDIIYFKPLNELYVNHAGSNNVDTLVCFNREPLHHPIGFMMSSPENQFYQYIFAKSCLSLNRNEYQSAGPDVLKNCFPSLDSITQRFDHLTVANLQMNVVYPLNHNYIPHIYNGNHYHYITADTIGIHWYGGHPESGRWQNILNERNFKDYESVICQIISRVL